MPTHEFSLTMTLDVNLPSPTLSSSSAPLTPATSSSSCLLLPFAPAFPFLPPIRVPPPLILSDIPLRERRGFTSNIIITPRPDLGSVSMPAKGDLEPKAGSLPRRRRASSLKPVTIRESKRFEINASESDDEED